MSEEIKPQEQVSQTAPPKAPSPMERLKALDELVAKAVTITREAVEAGEFHLQPVYTGLRAADAAIKTRIYQIDDSGREAENAKKTAAAEAERKADAAKKAADEKARADAAIAKQRAEEAAEKERQRVLQVQRTGTTRQRYMLKTDPEIKAIAGGVLREKYTKDPKVQAMNKGQLVNLILQAEGYQVTVEEQDAANKGE